MSRFDFSTLKIPVVQAPMAGGVNTPALAAAVANAGGVGSFGFAYTQPSRIAADLAAARALTGGALNANFFLFNEVTTPSPAQVRTAIEALQKLPGAVDVNLVPPGEPWYPDLAAMLEPVWAHRPQWLTFHFGAPPVAIVQRAHDLGIAVGASATSIAEARRVQACGADFVIAQGVEAGGHRGCFDPALDEADDEGLGALELTRALCRAVSIPIITAGGLMDGNDVRQAMNAGAVAAQMGTAFLCCPESGASAAHKRLVLEAPYRGTVVTRVFSGRRARGIRNAFIDRCDPASVLSFPIQNTLTGPIRAAAAQRDDGEYQSLWAGSAYGRAKAISAAALMADIAQALGLAERPVTQSADKPHRPVSLD